MKLPLVAALLAAALCGCSEYEYVEARVRDVFALPDVDTATDVLFVIDDSASMAEEQERLGRNFEAFVDVVSDSYADFQLGVVTTDVEAADAGVLRGGVMDRDTVDLAAVFLDAVSVGTGGSRDEQGFAAASLALRADVNAGFVREGARLDLAFLSDEDDHSPDSVDAYLEVFRSLALGGAMSVHALVGDLPDGCASGVSAAEPGERYLTAAVHTGGYTTSICAEDYSGILARIGLEVSGLTDTFLLSQVPQVESLRVWVDSIELHQRDEDGWRYEPGDNALVFTGCAIPRPGMEVVAEYELLMGAQVQ